MRMIPGRAGGFIRAGLCFVGLMLALLRPAAAAALSMHFTPNGVRSLLLTGEDLAGVAALQIKVDYDPLILSSPWVSRITGGSVTGLQDAPGVVFINVDRVNTDAELSLFLYFYNETRQWARGVKSVTAVSGPAGDNTLPDPEAGSAPPDTLSQPGPGNEAEQKQIATGKQAAPGASSAANPLIASVQTGPESGIVQRPGADVPVTRVITTTEESWQGRPDTSSGLPPGALNTDVKTGFSLGSEQCVLRRFIEFKGKKDLRSFAALFVLDGRGPARQHPSIALSDGKTPVTITLELQQAVNDSPEIAVWDATLVALHKEGAKTWSATVVPSEGAWDVKIIFKVGLEEIEFPLVVAPRVRIADNINEKNALEALNRFCNEQPVAGTWKNVPHLNDYIFTANYLVNLSNSSSSGTTR